MSEIITIKNLPENERPQERLLRYGAESLSNAELLAIILRTGIKNENVIQLSNRVIKTQGGLNGLLGSTAEDFKEIKGIGLSKTAQILAVAEISKRFRSYKSGVDYKISKPKDAADLVKESMKSLNKEVLKIILLNTKNVVLCIKDVSMGSLNSSIVHPREVFIEAVKKSAASIIVCHNHPSGDPTPSKEDINITCRLKECGKLLGIEFVDHIIIGGETFISLKEKGIV
ncbi:DNA replication and repair protein RadC [Clostridium collagenovorans DSM 3089]|uniref:DNA replication and repair protein RadC n=1 Tax=Clostridium collagenovorans DSM 3089 TaxID=1121306 RepID=A0A1M5XS85_9CLOT|nr:DNA repair protein RadC [Clostridium collagenovorans]SHI02671.1 DNA replication and repair protein RadC [Clostridium collagenovorans DSM 3089]